MRFVLSVFLTFFIFSSSVAQLISIKGTISDEDGPLPGATVQVVGTQKGSVSDVSGNFMINGIEQGDYKLKFRAIGYKEKEKNSKHKIKIGELFTSIGKCGLLFPFSILMPFCD